ncbi:MAG: signal peptidase I [bacterium]|nr:signal peptidase I [bacterium]
MPKKKQSIISDLIFLPIRIFFFLFRLALLVIIITAIWYLLQMFGIFTVQIPVSGASMLPTLPEKGRVGFQLYVHQPTIQKILPQSLQRGDIVVFENEKTRQELLSQEKDATGFVKRVVGVSGDKVEIRDGFVYVNGKIVSESYTYKPRSTFGGLAVQDCQVVRVPEDKLFVLGDNRKVSMDSRQIGLVSIEDVQYYIPFQKQPDMFGEQWRDPSLDSSSQHSSIFNIEEFIDLLNVEREKRNLSILVYEPLLEESAKLRAQVMLKYDEFDSDAPKSGYSMADAMADVGYSNIVYGEFPLTGYYDAQELFDAFMEQPGAKKFLFNEFYEDIGVSTFVGELNGCPVQVVVQHLAGYVPPNYGDAEIAAWKEGLDRLRSIQPGWQKLKEYDEFYNEHKGDVNRMNEIITTRIQRFESIIVRLDANEWMTNEEKAWVSQDSALGDEQNTIAERLNTKN